MCDILNSIKQEIDAVEADQYATFNTKTDLYGAAGPSLLNIPVEIFLKICSFLDADFISSTLSKVCSRFENILTDIKLWRYWVNRRIKNTYPALPHLKVWDEKELNWEEACIEIDREYKKWSHVDKHMRHVVVKDVHFASVDSILLINSGEICISGSRDRSLAVWKVQTIQADNANNEDVYVKSKPEKLCLMAHSGWIWDLASDSSRTTNVIYSASWDNTVKAWDLEKEFTCTQTFQCGLSALSVVTTGDLVLTGLYSKQVLIFDIRVGPKHINSYKVHKGPVLALAVSDEKIASISEDKTLAVWDSTAGKTLVSDVRMPSERSSFPGCISWSAAALYIGDSKGRIHLVDPEEFVNRGSHEIWPEPELTLPSSKVTGIHQGLGSMIVCSDKGDLKYFYNSFPPEQYMSLKSDTHDVTKLQYQNDILAIGTCDSALEFWFPK